MEKKDGEVKDLVEKLERREITIKEISKTLEERKLTERALYKNKFLAYMSYLIWVIPCFLPAIAKALGWKILSFFAKLTAIEFPTIVICLSIVLFITAIPLTALAMFYNIKKGGCNSEDSTIILLKQGPYKIVRHPSNVAWSIFFITIPIILSKYTPFTILSVIGIVAIVAFNYYESVKEEKELDIRKWGDEYRQYTKEVPRWNIFKGLWNLWKRK